MTDSHSNVFVLSRINQALRADFQHLADADTELQSMLKDIRTFGERILPTAVSETWWQSAWSGIDSLLDEIRAYTLHMRDEMQSENASSPLAEFNVVTTRDERLHRSLYEIGGRLDHALTHDEDRSDWVDLWESLQAQLDIIRSYMAAARARIEMRRKHGATEGEKVREEVLSHLPKDASLKDADRFSDEYESALQRFQRDKHRTGGLIDIFKGLLLIQEEGPEAKVLRHMRKPDL